MMTPQTLKFGLYEIEKSRYLESETLFFFSNKKIIDYPSRATL